MAAIEMSHYGNLVEGSFVEYVLHPVDPLERAKRVALKPNRHRPLPATTKFSFA